MENHHFSWENSQFLWPWLVAQHDSKGIQRWQPSIRGWEDPCGAIESLLQAAQPGPGVKLCVQHAGEVPLGAGALGHWSMAQRSQAPKSPERGPNMARFVGIEMYWASWIRQNYWWPEAINSSFNQIWRHFIIQGHSFGGYSHSPGKYINHHKPYLHMFDMLALKYP